VREIGQGREKLEESEEPKAARGGGTFKSGVREIDYTGRQGFSEAGR
jgi:hypothetical protein